MKVVLDLPPVSTSIKKIGKGKIRKGKVSSFTVSGRLITDDEVDLGQVKGSVYSHLQNLLNSLCIVARADWSDSSFDRFFSISC